MLIGDFDETLFPSDQRGGIFNRNRAITFSTFLDNCNLLNLTTIGGSFTWHCNNNGLCILSKKLDRGLANVAWRLAFPEAFVEVLCRLHSDHNPLLLRFGGLPINRGIRPFRFEATWIDHEDYADLVDRAWRSSNHNITSALGKVRDQSIIFNLAVFGNIFRRKNKGGKQAEGGPKVSWASWVPYTCTTKKRASTWIQPHSFSGGNALVLLISRTMGEIWWQK